MLRIHALANRKAAVHRHLHPLLVHKNALKEHGFDVGVYHDPGTAGIADCDTLLFFEGSYRDILPIEDKTRDSAIQYLSKFFPHFRKVAWFDDHDSSGMIRVYVLDIVDIYIKSQILIDKTYYLNENITGIKHLDYVIGNFGVQAKGNAFRFKGCLEASQVNKLRVGWNLGLREWSSMINAGSSFRRIRRFLGLRKDIPTSTPKLRERRLDVSYRVGMREEYPPTNWWRAKAYEILAQMSEGSQTLTIRMGGKVTTEEYFGEMIHSKIIPSPFGHGEICYRDFECFMCGALLLKPRMDHIDTYPNFYDENVTYVAHNWDFSDFEGKVREVLSDPERFEAIATEGQRRFYQSVNDVNGFIEIFKKSLI